MIIKVRATRKISDSFVIYGQDELTKELFVVDESNLKFQAKVGRRYKGELQQSVFLAMKELDSISKCATQ